MTRLSFLPLALPALLLAACQGSAPAPETPAATEAAATPAPAGLVGETELLEVTGTEPFWGAKALGALLRYSTPENISGDEIAIARSEADGVLTLSGSLDGGPFALVVTEGECSDGMSDRTYPFTAVLTLGAEVRNGCAWSASRGFEGPENP